MLSNITEPPKMTESWLKGRLATIVLINDCCYFTVGMFFNLTLLFLVQKRTPRFLRPYAKILTIHCVSDIFNEFVMFFLGVVSLCGFVENVQQTMPMNERMYFLPSGIMPNPKNDPDITMLQCCMYVWIVISLPIGLATLDFGYRYLLICRQIHLTIQQLILYVMGVYFATFLMGFVLIKKFIMRTDPAIIPQWQKDECIRGLGGLQEVPVYGVCVATEAWTTFVMIMLNVGIITDYSFIGYVVRKIGEKTRKEMAGRKSSHSSKAQRQITMIMLVQASIPLLLCIPTAVNICCCFFKLELPNLGRGLVFFIPWLAAIRPFATILIVPHYRRVFRHPIEGESASSVGAITAPATTTNRSRAELTLI